MFSRRVGDAIVELEVVGEVLRDIATGTTFDPATGRGLSGPLATSMLERLPAATSKSGFGPTRTAFFQTLWPDATVWWP